MLTLSIILAAVSLLMVVLLFLLGYRNAKLTAENAVLHERNLSSREAVSRGEDRPDEPALSADDILEAIRHAGYVPDKDETWIRFMVQGEAFYVDTDRLPLFFVERHYTVDPAEWDMDLLRQAAHLMSDELTFVKATFGDESYEDGKFGLRYFIAALDRNYPSLRDNITRYVSIIKEAAARMGEIYNELEEKRKDASLAVNPFKSSSQGENPVLS